MRTDREVPWTVPPDPNNAGTHSVNLGNRTYSFMVDRRETDPDKRQAWWPSDQFHRGYDGRWGPRVTLDARAGRAGMRFPDFGLMFLRALARKLSSWAPR